jgi:hypothetical protein
MKYFVLHDENEDVTYRLPLVHCPMDDQEFGELVGGSDKLAKIEMKYGIHDVAYDENDFFGFSSYEIEDWKFIKTFWEKWLQKLGFVIGEKGWEEIKAV